MRAPLSPVHRHDLVTFSCNIEVEDALVADGVEECFSMEAVEAEDLSTKEFAVEDEESSMEESEVKLGGKLSERDESVSERDESVAEAGRGGLLSAG